ncbi:hypothetical protein GCM10010271_57590 [Streptomyces kurssanovii]|nr:hypothetical protein GCM10010271_57590 [Streptomyces kurssanovii]
MVGGTASDGSMFLDCRVPRNGYRIEVDRPGWPLGRDLAAAGPDPGTRRDPGCRAGGRGQRDHCPHGCGRAGNGGGTAGPGPPARGHRVSADTVAGLLREEGFSLQANAKTLEGAQHPDGDAQFRYINAWAKEHMDAGDPVISVDTKKK